MNCTSMLYLNVSTVGPAGTRKKTTIKIAMMTTTATMRARIITRSC